MLDPYQFQALWLVGMAVAFALQYQRPNLWSTVFLALATANYVAYVLTRVGW